MVYYLAMTKPLNLSVDRSAKTTLAEQIRHGIATAIESGVLEPGARLRSEHTTYCPYKGDASYYGIPAGGDRSRNAVWTYETPFEAMAQIKDHLAFYLDRVDKIS
jgi:uncharacterized protein (DUF427 family)